MRTAVTPAQAKAQDAWWIERCGIPSMTLMERAACGVADAVLRHRKHGEPVVILCGRGNNAGDGYLAAQVLQEQGVPVTAVALYARDALTPDAKSACDRAVASGAVIRPSVPPLSGTVVVDALFGVGLSRPLTGELASLAEKVNNSDADVIAVDLPSGLDSLGGADWGACIRAAETVTFQHEKTGMLLGHGHEVCGSITVCQIADEDAPLSGLASVLEQTDISRLLPRRPRDSHKGRNGTALLLTGSPAYTGAAILSAKACLRAGAGIVHVCAPHPVCDALRCVPELILTDTGTADWGADACAGAIPLLSGKTAVGCGCGVGKEDIVPLLTAILERDLPAVLDADALNQLATHPPLLARLSPRVVLTPHPGEMARLTGMPVSTILRDPIGAATRTADAWGCTVLLKGAGSVIAGGGRCVLSTTGNAGLAKGGSGDVLTGVITAMLAQGLPPFDAACVGAYLLGVSAERAYTLLGERMLTASDVIGAL